MEVTLLCWTIGFLILKLNKYTFKHPTTRLVPSSLRHTWFAGLSIIIATFIFCLPGFFAGFWTVSTVVFAFLLVKFRSRGVQLFVDDLKSHRRDKRGLFQHSRDCYMVGGETATFMKKYFENRKSNPFEQN